MIYCRLSTERYILCNQKPVQNGYYHLQNQLTHLHTPFQKNVHIGKNYTPIIQSIKQERTNRPIGNLKYRVLSFFRDKTDNTETVLKLHSTRLIRFINVKDLLFLFSHLLNSIKADTKEEDTLLHFKAISFHTLILLPYWFYF